MQPELFTQGEIEERDLDGLYAKSVQLFVEYHQLPHLIPIWEAKAHGDNLAIEPHMTMKWGHEEDNLDALGKLLEPLTETQEYVVSAVIRHLPLSSPQWGYLSRAFDALKRIEPETRDEKELIDGFIKMIEERLQDRENVPMTSTERYASMREREIEQARQEVARLRENERILLPVITYMRYWMPISYALLFHHYVEGLTQDETCEKVKFRGASLTENEFRKARQKGIKYLIDNGSVQTLVTSPHRGKNGRPKSR